ncbi:hypothetical protein [Halorussus halophilus]|uniref:hypothetical protein n=1 Tax=Halorussus halophilus TaxID=2650975 RepID=UPI001300CC96|nr:hypothetical protein [Halorussus halophilus]
MNRPPRSPEDTSRATDRRGFLALVGAGALAGCLGGSSSAPGETTASTTPTTTNSDEPISNTSQTTENDTETPDSEPLPVGESRFEGDPCPPFFGGNGTCYHALSNGVHDDAYIVPESEVLEGPSDATTFTLYNGSEERIGMNPYSWTVAKRRQDGWSFVAPHAVPEPYTYVEPGGRFAWQFAIGDASADSEAMGGSARVEKLGPGVYAFVHAGALALFEVTGDPLVLEPDDVTATERDGDVLTVRTGRAEASDAPETLELVEATNSETAAPLVAEQVIQSHGLRNGLPYLLRDEITTVRVETTMGHTPIVLGSAYRDPTREMETPPRSERVYEYEGVAFRVPQK